MKASLASVALVGAFASAVIAEPLQQQQQQQHGARPSRRHNSMTKEVRRGQSMIKRGQTYSGQATFYNTETGNAGACGGYLSNSGYTVALNALQYGSEWCGKTITISANGKTHSATIEDECPGDGSTCKWGALDMSPALFKYFADASAGVFDMTWTVGGDAPSSGSSSSSSNNDDNDKKSSSQKQQHHSNNSNSNNNDNNDSSSNNNNNSSNDSNNDDNDDDSQQKVSRRAKIRLPCYRR